MNPTARKSWLAIAVAALLTAGLAAAAPIRPDVLLGHIKFLASDDLKGRASGSPELEKAADYIAEQFRRAGLEPAGEDGWFQPFELDAGVDIGEGNSLSLSSPTRTVSLVLGRSYYPISAPANDQADVPSTGLQHAPLVFAGYGISAPGVRYDDYADIQVGGKVVLVFGHEPQEQLRTSRLNGDQPLPESSVYAKAVAARARGAVALLIVSDASHETDPTSYSTFANTPDADDLGIPVLRIRREEIAALIAEWHLDDVARAIDRDLTPRSVDLQGSTVDYREFLTRQRRTVRNVIGILRASGERGREAVVIGAHYDHVGLGGRYSVVPDRVGEIHNGADDNASGTAAIIEIAKSAAAEPKRFPRTLVFVAFAGEERGLLGSAYYTSHPVIPLADTVAMLNLDMVGRLREAVDVSGLDSGTSLPAQLTSAAKAAGNIRVRQEGPGAGRSDDYSFLQARVPAVNFFTGFHRDYHHPADDWQRINAEGAAKVARLALELAARLATQPARPEFRPPPQ